MALPAKPELVADACLHAAPPATPGFSPLLVLVALRDAWPPINSMARLLLTLTALPFQRPSVILLSVENMPVFLCILFFFFLATPRASRVFVPQPGTELLPSAEEVWLVGFREQLLVLEGGRKRRVLTIGPPGMSCLFSSTCLFFFFNFWYLWTSFTHFLHSSLPASDNHPSVLCISELVCF